MPKSLSLQKIRIQAIIHYYQQLQRLEEEYEFCDKKIDEWSVKLDEINAKIMEQDNIANGQQG
jgi:hypothetical protein